MFAAFIFLPTRFWPRIDRELPFLAIALYIVCRGVLAVAPDADDPTRTRTLILTRTLWGDLCLDAVACEGSRLISLKGDAVDGGCVFQKSRTRVCI